ncbi:MAG: type II toxin-antitoxin system HipA family toxin [Patulibacter sp.]
MPSDRHSFVWIWLPGKTEPVVAGRLDADERSGTAPFRFTYGQSYLGRSDAIPLFLPELPLRAGPQLPHAGDDAAGCILDSGPDAWGQRVLRQRLANDPAYVDGDPDRLDMLLASGSDRTGALDFQISATTYVPRTDDSAPLEQLLDAAALIEAGEPLPPALDNALLHGSSIGGARPKARLHEGERSWIAKFASSTDHYPVVQGEFVAMELAHRVGLDVARVRIEMSNGRPVLLVERFDRTGNGGRRAVVSALTVLGLSEIEARYASYADLATEIRHRFVDSRRTLRELFARIVFSVLISNTDDHPRNHAAFWDGSQLTLTPAYDLCPQPRAGGETRQVMAIGSDGWRMSQLAGCVERAGTYLLSEADAREIVDHQLETIRNSWDEVCDQAQLGAAERDRFWGRQFLNPYVLDGYGRG